MFKFRFNPYIIVVIVFIFILITQPVKTMDSNFIFNYIASFVFFLVIAYGVNLFISRNKIRHATKAESGTKQTPKIEQEGTTITIKIKISDLNDPDMDMLALYELFEDVVGKPPFTDRYDDFNGDPLEVILEATDTKKAEQMIKEIMDGAEFTNPKTDQKEKMFKDYSVEVGEG
ncbi:MAG: hypothetical protein WCK98_01030 [bacterium]